MLTPKVFALVILLSSANGLIWGAPKATPVSLLSSEASKYSAPKVTLAPYAPYDLLKRQQSPKFTVIEGPDNTCGFFGSLQGAPLTCPTTDTCMMLKTASGPGYGQIGCCPIGVTGPSDLSECGFRSTCIDWNTFFNSTVCNADCIHDTHTLKCTSATAPYCNTIIWPQNGVMDYMCDKNLITSLQTLYTTYRGQTGLAWLTTILSDSITTPITSRSSTPSATHTTPSTSSSPSSSSLSPTPIPTSAPSSSTPIGPIVGGVVGGVALIAGLITALIFYLRHQKKKIAAAAPTVAAAPAGPGAPPQPIYTQPDVAATAAGGVDPSQYYAQYGASPEMGQQQQGFGAAAYYAPQQGYYAPQGPSPTSAHLSSGYPDRVETTSPVSSARLSSPEGGSTGYASTSPRPGYSEMSANMAGGPFPNDRHEGTWEMEGDGPDGVGEAGGRR